MKERILNNWGLKLASVATAVVLWVVNLNINDPVTPNTIRNIPVTFINAEAITGNHQVYEVLDGTDVIRSVSVSGPRSVVEPMSALNINAEADLSKVKPDGTVEVKLYTDKQVTIKPSTSVVRLFIENRVERYFPLEVELTGIPRDGYIVGSSKLDLNRIMVSGGESKVGIIDKVKAIVDVTDTSGDIYSYANIMLYDSEGKEVSRDTVSVNMDTVGTTIEILKTKTVPVVYTSEGTAAEGYSVTGEVTSVVNELVIAGKESALAGITEIVVGGEGLYFEGAQDNVIKTVDLDNYLPQGIIRADKESNGNVDVTIHVSPIIEKEYTITMGQVQIENVPEGYSVVHVYASAEMDVTVKGSEYLLSKLDPKAISGSFDVTAWMKANNIRKLKDKEVLVVEPIYKMSDDLEVVSTASIEIIAKVLEE